jgi:hypothetical protein
MVNWLPNSKRKRLPRWNTLSKTKPFLPPLRDLDGDGVWNVFDCKPFDWKKQGKIHEESKKSREEKEEWLKEVEGKE